MTFSTIQKDQEDFEQQFFGDQFHHPIAKINSDDAAQYKQENDFHNGIGGKIIPNFLIVVGSFFLFTQTALNFLNYVIKPKSTISQPLNSLLCLVGGLLVLFLSLGKIKKKTDWLLIGFFPLMGIIFSFVFNLIPNDRLMLNAFAYSLFLTYPLVLFLFYYLKNHLENSDD